MELEEIFSRLSTLGIPVAYMCFESPQTPPFLIYRESGTDIRGADRLDLYRETGITAELYTDSKDITLERRIEALFRNIPLDKSPDTWISGEGLLRVDYSFTAYQKITEPEG